MISVLTVTVNDKEGELYPSEPQYGGVFGDNEALVLEFAPLDDAYRYQIEVVDGSGGYDITLPLAAQDGKLRYAVPAAWTAPGTATVRLVAVGADGEELLRHYAPIRLRFSDREQGEAMGDMLPRWQTVMINADEAAQKASSAAYTAEVAALTAREAAQVALQAKGPKGDKGDKGDDNVLHVTVANFQASHTPREIKKFVDAGGLAVLGDGYFLTSIDDYAAYFLKSTVDYGNQVTMRDYSVFEDGSCAEFTQTYTIPDVNNYPSREEYEANVQAVNDRVASLEEEVESPSVAYTENKTVYLGDNVLGEDTLGDGWTKVYNEEQERDIYTHSLGATADLTFRTNVEAGHVYLLKFISGYSSGEFVRVGLGSQYRVRCYQKSQYITVPLYAAEDNATLYFTPDGDSKPKFQMASITLCKIQDTGKETELALYNTTTENHPNNYGFWNTFIGNATAEKAVGSTRCIAIGQNTMNEMQGGHRNIGIGTYALAYFTGGEENVAIGADSMMNIKEADNCIAIGMNAMSNGYKRTDNIAIGKASLYGNGTADDANVYRNIAIGNNAGYNCASHSNIMIGENAGYKIKNGYQNISIGVGATAAENGNFNTLVGANTSHANGINCSTAIGYGSVATKTNQVVIGKHNGAWGDTTETLVCGNLVVYGTDGVKRQIVFNADGTCSWTEV